MPFISNTSRFQRVLLLFFTIALNLFGSTSTFAKSTIYDAPVCEAALTKRTLKPRDLKQSEIVQEPSVIVDGQRSSSDGHPEFVLKLIGESWFSIHTPDFAVAGQHGDPRSIAIILGKALTDYFGIYFVGEDKIIIPHVDVINRKLTVLNKALKSAGSEKIPIQFYLTDDPLVDEETYGARWTEGKVPISSHVELFIHDVSFHLATFVFPADFLSEVIQVAQIHTQFLNYLRAGLATSTVKERKILEWAIPQLEHAHANLTDLTIGNLIDTYKQSREPHRDPVRFEECLQIGDSLIELYFGDGGKFSLRTALLSRIHFAVHNGQLRSQVKRSQFLEEELKNFTRTNPQLNWDEGIRRYNTKSLIRKTTKRIKEFQTVL